MAKKLIQISRLPVVLLGVAFIFSAIGVGTNAWQGGSLFATSNLHWGQLCTAVGALMILGCIGMGFAFLLAIYWTKYPDMEGPVLLAFYINLYVGTAALTIAILVFTTQISMTWSFLMAIMACHFAVLVIWADLPMLTVTPLPWKRRQRTIDPANLTYETPICKLESDVGNNSYLFSRCYKRFNVTMLEGEDIHHYGSDLVFSKKTNLDASFSFLIRNPVSRNLVANSNLVQDCEPSQSHDTNFVENVTIIETAPYKGVADRTATKMATKKPSAENLLRTKTIFKEYYFTDRNFNLVGLDWIDELNLIQFPDENETCQTPTLEPADAGTLVKECNQCLHISEIPTQSSKPDSPRTQFQLTTFGPTKVRHILR
ncbi:hypothetical protein ACTXT7_012411 [Hymenolepis weldensis]